MMTTRYARTPKPSGSTFEVLSWFYMRASGALLALMVVFHLIWMHYVIGLTNINFDVIAGRWTGPGGIFWRSYDLTLLILASLHGMNGIRFVTDDYIHNRGWRAVVKALIALVLLLMVVFGGLVIFTFNG
ncbi:MAG TPA: succinate dehydrogenase [Anaerolineae bacterium]|nr:succinate dehydrogenase [Anaerolineae bacterium]